jgi:hypothetical protein
LGVAARYKENGIDRTAPTKAHKNRFFMIPTANKIKEAMIPGHPINI